MQRRPSENPPESRMNLLNLILFINISPLMLTDTPPESRAPVQAREHPWLLLLLVFAWLWPGVFSHDLWNPAEPQVYAAVENFIRGGNAWMPAVLGEPYFDVSPVYVWVAAFFQTALSPWAADVYSASRFATVLFTAIGLTGCGMAGYRFLGRHQGRSEQQGKKGGQRANHTSKVLPNGR